MEKISTENNFDLLRLFAALQVALSHSMSHLDHPLPILSWIAALPGVPIFFFLSGLLIYGSYTSSLNSATPLKTFYTKRFLRLYPGLWVCFFFSIGLVALSGYFHITPVPIVDAISWGAAQLTFFQFYHADFLRSFGVGALNGALWTIAVELQFYILFPLIHRLLKVGLVPIVAIMTIFIILNFLNSHFNPKISVFEKLFEVSFLPWIYMFLTGAVIAHFSVIRRQIVKVPILLAILLFIVTYLTSIYLEMPWGNSVNFIGFFVIAILCFRIAFYRPTISDRILRKNDISYGIYIFHMPIINSVLYKFGAGDVQFYCAFIATILTALLSWFFIERPCLRMKTFQARAY